MPGPARRSEEAGECTDNRLSVKPRAVNCPDTRLRRATLATRFGATRAPPRNSKNAPRGCGLCAAFWTVSAPVRWIFPQAPRVQAAPTSPGRSGERCPVSLQHYDIDSCKALRCRGITASGRVWWIFFIAPPPFAGNRRMTLSAISREAGLRRRPQTAPTSGCCCTLEDQR